MATVDERVALGISKIRPVRPRWFDELEPSKLNIASTRECVCGQLFGTFHEGIAQLGITDGSAEYGFALGDSNNMEMVEGWRRAIDRERERELVLA